jgi:hypothetical protein
MGCNARKPNKLTLAPPRANARETLYKSGINRILGRDWSVSRFVEVQLYLVSNSVNYQRLTWAIFIVLQLLFNSTIFIVISAAIINSLCNQASTKSSILAHAKTNLRPLIKLRYLLHCRVNKLLIRYTPLCSGLSICKLNKTGSVRIM